ncbi:uncharacterized protein AB675_6737 [Cyphellophora attinorum]|uniref:Uncharacterized protein n=1 Tax=Cyphellophora attinorum TaxID=1664694 RepID=A0A0N0NQ47_9EURO|nr:uncharacterized protein AB675_6737 [Phialophora attinorum]KPI43488.1 hypothetical protein AB675_6737 [Phialophora attinorum]
MPPSLPAQQQLSSAARSATLFDNSSQSSTTSQISQAALPPFPDVDTGADITSTVARDLTPPSSASSSVQEDVITAQDSPTPRKNTAGIKPDSPVSAGSVEHGGVLGRARADSAAGSKRTASGHIKQPSQTYHDYTPRPDHKNPSHTRSSSAASVGSNGNVAEISQHLRTKLKYAMVKVQHGWQTRSLEELESLASASPRSTASAVTQTNVNSGSPRRLIHQRLSRKWSDSSSSVSSQSELYNMASPQLAAVPESGSQLRGLAPPADIIAGQRRRPPPNESTDISLSQDPSRTVRPAAKQRTPSQNAVLEKDAVETLLFMASPNNSSYHVSSQPSQESSLRSTQVLSAMTSPLRTQFSQSTLSSPKKSRSASVHLEHSDGPCSAYRANAGRPT